MANPPLQFHHIMPQINSRLKCILSPPPSIIFNVYRKQPPFDNRKNHKTQRPEGQATIKKKNRKKAKAIRSRLKKPRRKKLSLSLLGVRRKKPNFFPRSFRLCYCTLMKRDYYFRKDCLFSVERKKWTLYRSAVSFFSVWVFFSSNQTGHGAERFAWLPYQAGSDTSMQ